MRTKEITLPPSVATELVKHLTLNRFTKSGDLAKYRARFHKLNRDQQLSAIDLISTGTAAEDAIRQARAI